MMRPHCDYCKYEVIGDFDPKGVPCRNCVKIIKEQIEFSKNNSFLDVGKFRLWFPQEFFNKALLDDKLGYVTRQMLKKLRGFSDKFIK